MNSTQWRESKDEHLGVAAAAFIEDVSLFGRVVPSTLSKAAALGKICVTVAI